MFVANNANTWITYYNSKVSTGDRGAQFNLKYNTCKSLDIKHQLYGSALINEYSDHVNVYLSNYDEDAATTLKTASNSLNSSRYVTHAAATPAATFASRVM